ncbi:MAG TPA: sigma-70 family RNA polymerase sigma factor [Gemmataceae bacterium]|jgi:RNA polymerase sigma factor (sigma-70 family)|nr:sigma-70 family RNA polymerase sigma factor [Gemmataceae bacterium]
MTTGQAALIRRHLHRLTAEHGTAKLLDRELLERFIESHDEAAFEMLVERHGPMVLRVSQRVLQDRHAAEDVFQATFLVLLRKAKTLSKRELLANWLYGVAYRLALRSRSDSYKRYNKEARLPVKPAADLLAQVTGRELCQVLDEELQRLPQQFRGPFLLCFEGGQTRDQAARQLGCSLTTLKRRLEQGRELLRSRLARRGLTLSGVLVAAGLSPTTAPAAVPVMLLVTTTRLAISASTGGLAVIGHVSPNVARLANGALKAMMAAKTKSVVVILLAAMTFASGAGVLGHQVLGTNATELNENQASKTGSPETASAKPAQEKVIRNDFFGDPLPPGSFARIGSSRLRHGHQVMSIAYSKDGNKLVSAGADHLARLWDTDTGKEIRTFGEEADRGNAFAPSRWVHSVALSPDGKFLATGEHSPGWPVHTIRLWDIETGKEIRKIEGHKAGITALAFSPDSKTLASGSADKTVRLWQVATGEELREFTNHLGLVPFAAFGKDGTTIFSAGDKTARHWEATTGKELHTFTGHDNDIQAGALSSDGKFLATGDSGGIIRIWDAATGMEQLKIAAHEKAVKSVAFSVDNTILASGGEDQKIHLWDVATGKPLPEPRKQLNMVNALAFAPNGKTLASAGWVNPIHFWEVTTGKEVNSQPGHEDAVLAMRFSSDAKTLTTAGRDWSVRRWSTETGKELKHLNGNWAIALTPDCQSVFSAGMDGIIRLYDIDTGKEIRQYKGHEGKVEQVAVSPDGRTLASKGVDKTIRFWDVETGREKLKVADATSTKRLEFSPDGKLLAVGGGTPTVRLVDAGTGQEIRPFTSSQQAVIESFAFSPDSAYLATGDQQGRVQVWEVASGKQLHDFTGHSGYLFALAFSSDGRTLAVGSWANVRLWELASGKERAQYQGFAGDVWSLAFRPDGRALASGCGDTTVMIWDLSGRSLSGPQTKQTLTFKELDTLWDDLANLDASKAFRAIGALSDAPDQAVPLLAKHLQVSAPADGKLVAQLIKDLDNDDFDTRDKASAELEKLGEAAEPAIREAYKERQSAEAHLRLEVLLSKLDGSTPSASNLRIVRSLEVLERLGSKEAQSILQGLAKGDAESRLGKEAKAVLERLGKKR